MGATLWDKIKENPKHAVLFKRFLASVAILAGATYAKFPVLMAAVLGVNVDTYNGINEVQRFYGGGQIGLGLFMLMASTKEGLRAMMYTMIFLASARCVCIMPYIMGLSKLPFRKPLEQFTHLAVAFVAEFPIAVLCNLALQIWKEEFKKEEEVRKRVARGIGQSEATFFSRFIKVASIVALLVPGMGFLVMPRFAGELFELYAGSPLGIVEFQAMFGAFRLSLAMYLMGADEQTAKLFCLCFFGCSYLAVDTLATANLL